MNTLITEQELDRIIIDLERYPQGSAHYIEAAAQLSLIVDKILVQRFETTLFYDQIPEGKEDEGLVQGESPLLVRTLIAYLATAKKQSEKYRCALYTMLAELSALSDFYSERIFDVLLCCIFSSNVDTLKFKLTDAATADPDEICRIVNGAFLMWRLMAKNRTLSLERYGALQVANGRISISDSLANLNPDNYCLKVYERKLQVCTKDKFELVSDVSLNHLDTVTNNIISRMRHNVASQTQSWNIGDIVKATVVDCGDDFIHLKTVDDPDHLSLEGSLDLIDEDNLLAEFIDVPILAEAFPVGKELRVEVVSTNPGRFKIFGPLGLFCNDEWKHKRDKEFLARVVAFYADMVCLIDEEGHMALADPGGVELEAGDYCIIKAFGTTDEYGVDYAYALLMEKSDREFNTYMAISSLLSRFSSVPSIKSLRLEYPELSVKELVRALLVNQQKISDLIERYKILCIGQMLCEFAGQHRDAEYIQFLRHYIKAIHSFQNDKELAKIAPSKDIPRAIQIVQRCKVVDILRAMLQDDANTIKKTCISTDSSFVRHMADLALAYVHVGKDRKSDDNVYGAQRNIKKIMCGMLIADSSSDARGDQLGHWYGKESKSVELKASFYFKPAHTSKNYPAQQQMAIAQGVCAFMNTHHGGTLYLGVHDNGFVIGLDEDFRMAGEKANMDAYMDRVRNDLRRLLKPELTPYFTLEPEQDDRVLAIKVSPYPYGIAYTSEGRAFYRNDNGKNEMTDQEELRELINSRLCVDKHFADCYLSLQKARFERKQAVLKGYRSGNNPPCDRLVEPFEYTPDHSCMWCYEIERNGQPTGEIKQFRISRIQNVRILDKEWMHSSLHKAPAIDIFRMSGYDNLHVKLLLSQRAYNLLTEEYPASMEGDQLKKEVGNADFPWLLSTEIHAKEGICRFVSGLMNDVKIIDGEPLKEYLRSYLNLAMQKLKEN